MPYLNYGHENDLLSLVSLQQYDSATWFQTCSILAHIDTSTLLVKKCYQTFCPQILLLLYPVTAQFGQQSNHAN